MKYCLDIPYERVDHGGFEGLALPEGIRGYVERSWASSLLARGLTGSVQSAARHDFSHAQGLLPVPLRRRVRGWERQATWQPWTAGILGYAESSVAVAAELVSVNGPKSRDPFSLDGRPNLQCLLELPEQHLPLRLNRDRFCDR